MKVSKQAPPLKNSKDLNGDKFALCGDYDKDAKPGQRIDIKCKEGAEGRYVYVYIPKKDYLTLCEVEIYGNSKSKYTHKETWFKSFTPDWCDCNFTY